MRSLLSSQLGEIRQNIISRVNTIGLEKGVACDVRDKSLEEEECRHVVESYLSDNLELINEFFSGSGADSSSSRTDRPTMYTLERCGPGESGGEVSGVESILEEVTLRKKQVDLKLYSQLQEMFQPFFSTLDRFERIKVMVAEVVAFLGGGSGSDGYSEELGTSSGEFESLNRILLCLHKKRRVCLVMDRLRKLKRLKGIQSDVQLLLNGKEYEMAIEIMDESLELLGTEMRGVRAVGTLSTQLYEMQSVIEKLVCQDFVQLAMSWLSFGEVGPSSRLAQSDSWFELLSEFLQSVGSIGSRDDFKIRLFQEFSRVGLLLYGKDGANFSSVFSVNSVMDPILALIKKERINLAIDEFEIHINNFVDEANRRLTEGLGEKKASYRVQISHQGLELLLHFNIFDIVYKLIILFSVVIHSNRLLQGSHESQSSEAANKSLKHIYLPILQLLEQVLIRIFSKLSITGEGEGCLVEGGFSPRSGLNGLTMYYAVFLKYVILVTKLQNCFGRQIVLACSQSSVAPDSRTTNFFGKAAVDLRLSLYNYYKSIFERELIQKCWLRLSTMIDNERWEKKNLSAEYKQTFELFVAGRLGREESVGVEGYFVSYNGCELSLPECCLGCIELVDGMFSFIQKVPIISYFGLSRVLGFVLNYCRRCFENVIGGSSVNRGLVGNITAYKMILCSQNIYFWLASLKRMLDYQLRLLEKGNITDDQFVSENINLLNDENNLEVLLGVKLPLDCLDNIKVELNRVQGQLEQLMESSTQKISDVIIDRFRGFVGDWVLSNVLGKQDLLGSLKGDPSECYSVSSHMSSFMRDFNNMDKTLRKYMREQSLVSKITNRIEQGCLRSYRDFLLVESKSLLMGVDTKLNYFNLMFDLYFFHMEVNTPFANCGEKENKAALPEFLLQVLFDHFQTNQSKFDPEEISEINKIYSFIKNKLNT